MGWSIPDTWTPYGDPNSIGWDDPEVYEVGDEVRPKMARKGITELVTAVDDRYVTTEWETRTGTVHKMRRTHDEMAKYMERV